MAAKKPKGIIDDIGRAINNSLRKPVKPSAFTKMNKNSKMTKVVARGDGSILKKQPPKPKQLPSVTGRSPRPNVSKTNPKAPTTADMDRILKKSGRERAAVTPKAKPQKKMNPYYKTSKNSRNY